MTRPILNWVLMTVIAKFRETFALIIGRNIVCSGMKLRVTQCTFKVVVQKKFGNLVLNTSFTWTAVVCNFPGSTHISDMISRC